MSNVEEKNRVSYSRLQASVMSSATHVEGRVNAELVDRVTPSLPIEGGELDLIP